MMPWCHCHVFEMGLRGLMEGVYTPLLRLISYVIGRSAELYYCYCGGYHESICHFPLEISMIMEFLTLSFRNILCPFDCHAP